MESSLAVEAAPRLAAWNGRWWPTFAVMDRNGILQAMGFRPELVESVIEVRQWNNPRNAVVRF